MGVYQLGPFLIFRTLAPVSHQKPRSPLSLKNLSKLKIRIGTHFELIINFVTSKRNETKRESGESFNSETLVIEEREGRKMNEAERESGFRCQTAPGEVFASREALHEHYKSEWHRYNLKRKVAGIAPVPKAMFEKLQLIAQERADSAAHDSRKMDHIKKEKRQSEQKVEKPKEKDLEKEEEFSIDDDALMAPVDMKECFMDGKLSEDFASNLEYMHKNFGFFVPDMKYVSDLEGLYKYCAKKVTAGRMCLFCDRPFVSARAVIQHMIHKSHCKIPWEKDEHFAEYEDFFDFRSLWEVADEETGIVKTEFDAEMLDTGELVFTDRESGKQRIIGHRNFRHQYRQKPSYEETRPALLAASKERLMLAYQKAGIDTSSATLAKTAFNGERPAWMDKTRKKKQANDLLFAKKAALREGIAQNLLMKNRIHQKKQMGAGFGVHG